jgi:predicted nucleic acid-binding protein
MSYLLDTATVSEWTKPRPDPGVVRWLDEVDEDRTYLSVVTVAELRRGTERLATGRRRAALESWLDGELLNRFEDRLLPVERDIAHAWGRLAARLERRGRKAGAMDMMIAATAECRDLQVVTRNVADFEPTGVGVVNPWTAQPG